MQKSIVIGNENFKELVESFVPEENEFIFIPLADSYSEEELRIIESADIVFVAVHFKDSIKFFIESYPVEKCNKIIYICTDITWMQEKPFQHIVVCRQGELFNSVKALLGMIEKDDLMNLNIEDILSFCTRETEIYCCEAKIDLIEDKVLNILKLQKRQEYDFMIYVNGDVSLLNVKNIVDLLDIKVGTDGTIGVGYRNNNIIKVCLLYTERKQ